jgi:hypothetical protein
MEVKQQYYWTIKDTAPNNVTLLTCLHFAKSDMFLWQTATSEDQE